MAVKRTVDRGGWYDVGGIAFLILALLLLVSLVSYDPNDVSALRDPPNPVPRNLIGLFGAWSAYLLLMAFGLGGYGVPVALGAFGLFLLLQREGRVWPKAVWLFAAHLSVVVLFELGNGWWAGPVRRLNMGSAGGLIGDGLGRQALATLMGGLGATILCWGVLAASAMALSRVSPADIGRALAQLAAALRERWRARLAERRDSVAQLDAEERELVRKRRQLEKAIRRSKDIPTADEAAAAAQAADDAARPVERAVPPPPERAPRPERPARPEPEPPPRPEPESESAPAEAPEPERAPPPHKPAAAIPRPAPAAPAASSEPAPPAAGPTPPAAPYALPPIALLDELPPAAQRELAGDVEKARQVLIDTLADFGIDATVTNFETGPVVTRYELLPAAGVRVERIAALANNIALTMKAESVRVQAPIPGKGVVGIEVPNIKTNIVYLREVLESETWRAHRAAVPLAIGKDVGGRVIVADLADMPHLLIAGATGSGKTVCMNSLLTGLLMARTPDELRLMLVDPKIVEFSAYNAIPHLVVPVITDPRKVALGLRWAITEMESRYKLFAKAGVRNIKAFNARPIVKQADLFAAEAPPEESPIPDRLPYIVIVVDELADLMLVAQADIENSIARLAQLSRAVGIHMILATQRPSVNVITGTIKANFPARVAFQVAQRVDSRTILDANGADKLLGRGDMLFLPPGTAKLVRAQGCLTSDGEVRRIVEFCARQGTPQFEMSIKEKMDRKSADLPDMEEDDGLIEQAIEIIRQTQRASTSSLQRRLRIGYTRAARVMDLLEERGIVGPAQGSDPREILIDLDGGIPQNPAAEGEEADPA